MSEAGGFVWTLTRKGEELVLGVDGLADPIRIGWSKSGSKRKIIIQADKDLVKIDREVSYGVNDSSDSGSTNY